MNWLNPIALVVATGMGIHYPSLGPGLETFQLQLVACKETTHITNKGKKQLKQVKGLNGGMSINRESLLQEFRHCHGLAHS